MAMSDRDGVEAIEARLAALARAERAAAPRPGPVLVERVLGDAAEVSAARARATRSPAPRVPGRAAPRPGFSGRLPGLRAAVTDWRWGAAAAAMTAGLALGVWLGYGLEAGGAAVGLGTAWEPLCPGAEAAFEAAMLPF
jgi:hypothetical protein